MVLFCGCYQLLSVLCLMLCRVVSCRVVSVLCDPHILQLNCMLEQKHAIEKEEIKTRSIENIIVSLPQGLDFS
jgi:hypothetical protein